MNRIKAIRESKGLSQKQLANIVSVSAPFLCDLEKGRRGANPETWKKLADALGVDVPDLMERVS